MLTKREIDLWEAEDLLNKSNLKLPKGTTYSIGIFENNTLVGTGSLDSGVIKAMAIDEEHQGKGILNIIISDLISYGSSIGQNEFFIFTSSKYKAQLSSLGFKEIIEVDGIGLYEKAIDSIEVFKKKLSSIAVENASAIVMNGNPFTLGHLNLVERASRESNQVFLFVVEEDKSIFPFEDRFNLIKAGVRHLENVQVIPSGRYIISSLVFPTYFIKDGSGDLLHARIDLTIFSEHIAKTLGIKKRYVGIEPFCQVTRNYNTVMKEILPKAGVEVVEIDRFKVEGEYVSATAVRKAIVSEEELVLQKLLPKTTYEYLKSEEGLKVVEKLKSSSLNDYVNCKS